ncbi:hypothetical protein VIGAN_11113700, partial [Vigna angularis var. angularis]
LLFFGLQNYLDSATSVIINNAKSTSLLCDPKIPTVCSHGGSYRKNPLHLLPFFLFFLFFLHALPRQARPTTQSPPSSPPLPPTLLRRCCAGNRRREAFFTPREAPGATPQGCRENRPRTEEEGQGRRRCGG